MSRIEQTFAKLKTQKRSALITYIMAGDPNIEISQEILDSLPHSGADIIELGLAFSDPMADGIIIQDAANRALEAGVTTAKVLNMVSKFRKKDQQTPVILMGYFNPLFRYGIQEFCYDANIAGVDGLIIVDLPPEEDFEFMQEAKSQSISIIRLISPATPEERLKKVLENTSGFVYFISMAGITGTKTVDPKAVKPLVEILKKYTGLPIAVGFGIKTSEHVRAISDVADAVVVGSAIVAKVGDYANAKTSSPVELVDNIKDFIESLAAALK